MTEETIGKIKYILGNLLILNICFSLFSKCIRSRFFAIVKNYLIVLLSPIYVVPYVLYDLYKSGDLKDWLIGEIEITINPPKEG